MAKKAGSGELGAGRSSARAEPLRSATLFVPRGPGRDVGASSAGGGRSADSDECRGAQRGANAWCVGALLRRLFLCRASRGRPSLRPRPRAALWSFRASRSSSRSERSERPLPSSSVLPLLLSSSPLPLPLPLPLLFFLFLFFSLLLLFSSSLLSETSVCAVQAGLCRLRGPRLGRAARAALRLRRRRPARARRRGSARTRAHTRAAAAPQQRCIALSDSVAPVADVKKKVSVCVCVPCVWV